VEPSPRPFQANPAYGRLIADCNPPDLGVLSARNRRLCGGLACACARGRLRAHSPAPVAHVRRMRLHALRGASCAVSGVFSVACGRIRRCLWALLAAVLAGSQAPDLASAGGCQGRIGRSCHPRLPRMRHNALASWAPHVGTVRKLDAPAWRLGGLGQRQSRARAAPEQG
jgi:hypothetical protein